MKTMLSLFSAATAETMTICELLKTNELSQRFGLALSPQDAQDLAATRQKVLADNGRIEFGSGAIGLLVQIFASSPYLNRDTYAQTLHDLLEIFYYYKGEFLETIGDRELILMMKDFFDNECRGSLEMLQNKCLVFAAHDVRFGGTAGRPDDETEYGEDGGGDEE